MINGSSNVKFEVFLNLVPTAEREDTRVRTKPVHVSIEIGDSIFY